MNGEKLRACSYPSRESTGHQGCISDPFGCQLKKFLNLIKDAERTIVSYKAITVSSFFMLVIKLHKLQFLQFFLIQKVKCYVYVTRQTLICRWKALMTMMNIATMQQDLLDWACPNSSMPLDQKIWHQIASPIQWVCFFR